MAGPSGGRFWSRENDVGGVLECLMCFDLQWSLTNHWETLRCISKNMQKTLHSRTKHLVRR